MNRNLFVWWNPDDKLPYRLPNINGKIWFMCPDCKMGELISEREVVRMEDKMEFEKITFYPVFCHSRSCKSHDRLRLPVPRSMYS